jgi:hypothetical protein
LGCKCREDYIRLVNYCIEDEGIRRDLVWYFLRWDKLS